MTRKAPKGPRVGALVVPLYFVPGYPLGLSVDTFCRVAEVRAREARVLLTRDDGREGSWWVGAATAPGEIVVTKDPGEVCVGVRLSYLIDALAAAQEYSGAEHVIQLEIRDALDALVVKSETFLAVIMPMRI